MQRNYFFMLFIMIICIFYSNNLPAQTPVQPQILQTYSLQQAIEIAQKQSPDFKKAENDRQISFWKFKEYKASKLPQLMLRGELPDLSRTILSVTQNDGSEVFRDRSIVNSGLELNLTQNITATGGSVYVASQISRLDILGQNANVSYLTNPFLIGFRQPIFAFNPMKWDKKIEPLRYEESIKQNAEDLEMIAQKTSALFFNLLISDFNLEFSLKRELETDTIFKLCKERYRLGKITENELLQAELALLNTQNQTEKNRIDQENDFFLFRTYLKLLDNNPIKLILPNNINTLQINEEKAILEAKNNRSRIITLRRKLLEADRLYAEAKTNSGLNMNITGSFGYTKNSISLADAYIRPQDQQRFRVSFDIPLYDFGKAKAHTRAAAAMRDNMRLDVELSEQQLLREVVSQVRQFKIYQSQLNICEKTNIITEKRYQISINKYKDGMILLQDLQIAIQEQDNARRNNLITIKNYWNAYYQVKQLTMYDFK